MPAPDLSSSPRSLAGVGSVGLGAGAGLLLLTGPSLPLAWGVLPAAGVLVLALGLGWWRATGLRAGDGASVAAWQRGVLAPLLLLPMLVVVAAAARMIAGICVAYPPAIAALLVLGVLAPLACGRGARAGLLALLVAGLAIAAAITAGRMEAQAPGARGFAHTGPILGIHPFQATAIVIDGYGPFDLPINDYVEPDGSRGYGPQALAEALQRDLAAIAEQQFADGPARAYQAFAGARVEAVELPALQERLDQPIAAGAVEPRLVVWSGTTGWRSRVEFVCPGSLTRPGPRPADTVMDRMCPDKYSSEASAGLGVTGRWTGYTEGRGVGRPSLAGFGARNDPQGGPQGGALALRWEQRAWAWVALGLLAPVLLWPVTGRGLVRVGAGLAALGLAVLAVMLVGTWPSGQVPALASAIPWASPWGPSQWSPALALLLLASLGRRAAAGPTAVVGLASWGVAAGLAAAVWLRPTLHGIAGDALVGGLAEALHGGGIFGVTIASMIDLGAAEVIAASVVIAGLLGLLGALLGSALPVVAGLIAPRRAGAAARWIGLAVLLAAAALVLSRKTVGGAALLTPALALGLAAVTGLGLAAWRGPRRGLRIADHVLAVVLVVAAAGEAWAGRHNLFHGALLGLGVIAALVSLGLVAGPRRVRSVAPGPGKASQG
ncbi:MAG: hypothetical protein IPO88_17500 [Nannocystis sp.]|uniref:hypothetical protein n=1 Tax=Nannocystis sp. TaxID=1962667 RepID=UPI0024258F3D|nr:hypothetical protein [Nannocystis sp.]MBK9755261.1 hypothetical protein [Nannocystis sp.]